MNKISDQRGSIILISILILITIIAVYYQFKRENELKKNGIIINVEITDIKSLSKGSPVYEYKFFYNDKAYTKYEGTGIIKRSFIIGKKFPAIFSPSTGNSELLIIPEDFVKYDLEFPDSLKWVLKFRNN